MPAGSHKYFQQIDPHGGRISTDDPEFVAQVRAKLGPKYEHLVDENKKFQAANIGDPQTRYTYLGLNFPKKEYATQKDLVDAKTQFLDPITSAKDKKALNSPNVSIYGIGSGASPQVFAHEFRHNVMHDERNNRLLDIISANSPTQYRRNLESYYEYIRKKPADKVPLSELEYIFHEALHSNIFKNKNGKDDEDSIYAPPPLWEKSKQALENSGILNALPDVAQQYIQRKAAMDRVAQPYLNFGRAPPLGGPHYKDYYE